MREIFETIKNSASLCYPTVYLSLFFALFPFFLHPPISVFLPFLFPHFLFIVIYHV